MNAVDTSGGSAADVHRQNSGRWGIVFVIREFGDDPKPVANHFFRRVASFARFGGGSQAIGFNCRWNRPLKGVEHDFVKLALSTHFAFYPAGDARFHMAFDTIDALMRRAFMPGGKLGLHDMAALPAKLRFFHLLHRTVAQLAGDDYVEHGRDGKKDSGFAPSRSR